MVRFLRIWRKLCREKDSRILERDELNVRKRSLRFKSIAHASENARNIEDRTISQTLRILGICVSTLVSIFELKLLLEIGRGGVRRENLVHDVMNATVDPLDAFDEPVLLIFRVFVELGREPQTAVERHAIAEAAHANSHDAGGIIHVEVLSNKMPT